MRVRLLSIAQTMRRGRTARVFRAEHSAAGASAMTSLAIAQGWNMTSAISKREPDRSAWREVAAAWAVAAALAGALVLTVPNHGNEGSTAGLRSPVPAASSAHQTAADPEGPGGDEACADRDYANERC